jgi:PKD repeat protein
MSFQGTPGFQVSGSCPDAANGGVFTSGSADIGLLNGDPLACSATWIWDPTTQYALQAYLSMTGLDGQGDLENPDEYHTFGVNLPPPGPNAAFTSAAGSDPGAFTFTDSSFSVIPHVTITDEKWTSSDGGDGTGPTWDHTFDKDGTYDVTLEVTDSNGNTASVTHPVKVTTAGSGGSSASIEVKEKLSPSHDAGRFDLRVGAKKVKAKAANGDHGIAHMSAGTYLVRQVARTVGLTHYSVAMRCTKNGKQSLSASSTAGSLKVSAGDSVICTFTDTRTTSTHCDVPVLTGKSKGAAQKALAKAHCRLGAVHKAASAGSAPVVTSSSPGAYAVRKKNTKVSIHLAKKKK